MIERSAVHPTAQDASPKPDRADGRWARRLRWAGVCLVYLVIAGLVMAVLVQQPVSRLEGIAASAHRARYVGLAVQAVALGLLVAFWPGVVRWAATRGIVAPTEVHQVLAWRWKLAGWFTVFILFVGIGVGDLVHFGSAVLQAARSIVR